jgi:threonine dehydratase
MKITLKDVQSAQANIQKFIQNTPCEKNAVLSSLLGMDVFLKYENLQTTGSFKIRGALNKISSLSLSDQQKGLVAASAGNHAQGVALSAKLLGLKSTVVMPRRASMMKQAATASYGSEVVLFGEVVDDSFVHARKLEAEKGFVFIHPYEDEKIIAGQGTIGLELEPFLENLDSVVIPIGGGGLISGMSYVIKSLSPKTKVIGVVAKNAPGMYEMFKDETSKQPPSFLSIADGIAVKKPSPAMYEHFISKYVDDVVVVSDDEIASAIVMLIEKCKQVVEGSGAATLAALIKGGVNFGKSSALILSGGNIDLNLMGDIMDRGLSRSGRRVRIDVIVPDRPGTLARLTDIISQTGGNIQDVLHDRMDFRLELRETRISFFVETKDLEHVQQIKSRFVQEGIRLG